MFLARSISGSMTRPPFVDIAEAQFSLDRMSTAVRTRIAPAPSGSIHVGNAHTALFNWLFTRGQGGAFVLRIEDTDAVRVSDEHVEGVLEDLRWLGLDWDEGPEVGGPNAPYRQSERRDHHRARAEKFVAEGLAYRDYLSPDEHEELRRRAQTTKEPWRFSEWVRARNEEHEDALVAEGRPYTCLLYTSDAADE